MSFYEWRQTHEEWEYFRGSHFLFFLHRSHVTTKMAEDNNSFLLVIKIRIIVSYIKKPTLVDPEPTKIKVCNINSISRMVIITKYYNVLVVYCLLIYFNIIIFSTACVSHSFSSMSQRFCVTFSVILSRFPVIITHVC